MWTTIPFWKRRPAPSWNRSGKEGEQMGVAVRKLTRKGDPANEIVAVSKDYDLIVMGTLGLTGLSHFLVGSVAEKVVRFASCPVLVIRIRQGS